MKQLDEIKKLIAMNGGATFDEKGRELLANSGYMVSLAGFEKVTTLEALTEKNLKTYFKLAKKKHAYFGLWNDGGALYLDLSIKIEDKALARKIGKKNNQLAIFDLQQQKSIYLHIN